MSPKELLYLEDALGHVSQAKCLCDTYAGTLQNGKLKNLVKRLGKEQNDLLSKLYGNL